MNRSSAPSATRARRLREERTDHVPIYSERHALAVVNEHSDHFNNQRLTLNYRTIEAFSS
ncbi:hypothetical protein [Micromonospora rubida]|uniref:hypothetical protein n=1 Tax=Micromonospora rubida TaxID=2697657 RepID=UPI00137883D9|nr:hypothetical protein [Micromonospora rubida]NBE85267.1 hypothetical protein [Micromonospora rubida]